MRSISMLFRASLISISHSQLGEDSINFSAMGYSFADDRCCAFFQCQANTIVSHTEFVLVRVSFHFFEIAEFKGVFGF